MLGRVRGEGGKEERKEKREERKKKRDREKREVSYALASFFI